jgi:hypothetical protein
LKIFLLNFAKFSLIQKIDNSIFFIVFYLLLLFPFDNAKVRHFFDTAKYFMEKNNIFFYFKMKRAVLLLIQPPNLPQNNMKKKLVLVDLNHRRLVKSHMVHHVPICPHLSIATESPLS